MALTSEECAARDRDLLREIDASLARGARRATHWLACRAGCTECCIGPFPISTLDASRLRQGMDELRGRDPERWQAVRARAAALVVTMRPGLPGDAATGTLADDEEAIETFLERWAAEPCPALDPENGHCELYSHRPISCRTYGLPVRIGGESLPPCRLCFRGAGEATIESCRVEIDPHDLEGAILLDLAGGSGEPAQTLIAWALVGADD